MVDTYSTTNKPLRHHDSDIMTGKGTGANLARAKGQQGGYCSYSMQHSPNVAETDEVTAVTGLESSYLPLPTVDNTRVRRLARRACKWSFSRAEKDQDSNVLQVRLMKKVMDDEERRRPIPGSTSFSADLVLHLRKICR